MSDSVDVLRLFVALPVPATLRDRLDDGLAPLRVATPHLRWVPPETWHVTLAFLGDVPASSVDAVAAAVARGVAGRAALDLALVGASRFGRGLLFASLDDAGFAAVVELGRAVRDALGAGGIGFDGKPLHPHVTLARQRDRRGRGVSRSQLDRVEAVLAALPPDERAWRADEVVAFASHLGPGPVRHEPLAAVPLA